MQEPTQQNRNRDTLRRTSLYDTLISANRKSVTKICVLQMLDDRVDTDRCDKYHCTESHDGCLYECEKCYECCNQCIADWLNEDNR